MIVSHRGNGTGHPANSISAFESALRAGADGFECDLRLTGDGNVIVHHDGNFRIRGRKISIGRSTLPQLRNALGPSAPLLTLETLLDYIAQVRVPAFLELKNLSPALIRRVVEGTGRAGLWSFVRIIGFPVLIRNAILAQDSHPRLQVLRITLFPAPSLLLPPPRSDGAMIGWQDSVPGSEKLFRTLLPVHLLDHLRRRYEARGMRVIGGVINRADGFRHFQAAGITDLVTDDVATAVAFRDSNPPS